MFLILLHLTIHTMKSVQERVVEFLKEKKGPVSLKHISRELRLKKRRVVSVCHQDLGITKVHPSHCGSGKNHASIFMYTTDPKYTTVMEF